MVGLNEPVGTQIFDPQKDFIEKEAKRDLKQECLIRGGTWDEALQKCIEGQPSQEPFEKSEKQFDITTGQETLPVSEDKGAMSITTASDVESKFRKATAEEKGDVARLASGQLTLEGQQQQAMQQQQLADTISNIGRIGNLTPAQEAEVNRSQALTAGTVGQIPSILSTAGQFAVGGAIAGGAPTGGIGAIPGAAIGAAIGIAAGIARGYMGNIKEQQRGELQAADVELKNARTNMRQLAMLASQDPQNADVYISQYNAQLTRVYQARRQTKAEVSGDLNAFMEDGREQLADFVSFLQAGGIADIYGQKLQTSLLTGSPLDISGEEFLS